MFEVFEEMIEADGVGRYITYGIACVCEGERSAVSDLSLDRDKVQKLADLCNELQLDPVHLLDVAEDFVFEQGTYMRASTLMKNE